MGWVLGMNVGPDARGYAEKLGGDAQELVRDVELLFRRIMDRTTDELGKEFAATRGRDPPKRLLKAIGEGAAMEFVAWRTRVLDAAAGNQ